MIKDLDMIEIVKCKADDSVQDCAVIMKDKKVRHIFVEDDRDQLVGIVSPVDISNKLVVENKDPQKTKVKEIMNHPVKTVELNQGVEFAMKIMIENNTITVPVVDNGKAVGLVAYHDCLGKLIHKTAKQGENER